MAERQRLAGTNLALLLFLGAIWGTAFMFITLGLRSFSPVLFAALRFDIAGLAVLGIALVWRPGALLPRGKQWLPVVVSAALNVGAYHALLFWGQDQGRTSESVAAVIVGFNPIITTVFSRALLTDEGVGKRGLIGLGLGLVGIVLLAVLKKGPVFDAQLLGEIAVLGAVISWSLGGVFSRRSQHGLHPAVFSAWQMLLGAVFLHVTSLVLEHGGRATFDRDGIISLLYLALVSSAIGFIVYFTLIERIGPIRINLVSNVAPIFASVAGFVVLHDAFEPRAVVAYLLIVAGLTFVIREKG